MQSRVREEARIDLAYDQHKLFDAVTGNHRRQLNKCRGFQENILQERE